MPRPRKTRPLHKLVTTITPYELFILVISLFALGSLTAELFFQLEPDTPHILNRIDNVLCVIFFGDFLCRLFWASSKKEYLQWGWLDLISSVPVPSGSILLQCFRLARLYRVIQIVRTFKGKQSVQELKENASEHRAQSTFLFVSILILATVLFGSIAVLHYEKTAKGSMITDAHDAIWWSIVTITTVGYGDCVPVTHGGRIVAMIMMLVGVVMFGAYTGFITAWFMGGENKKLKEHVASLEQENAKLRKRLKNG